MLPEVSPETALLAYRLAYLGLIIGAALVLASTLLAFWSDGEIKRHDNLRLSANELETAKAIAESDRAKQTAADAQMRAARLNRETAKLQADNLALQTVMLPRHVGLFGINQRPPAESWFAGIEKFAGTQLLYQVNVGDKEAQNLANEIAIVLTKHGWKVQQIGTGISRINEYAIPEGLYVMFPTGKPWTAEQPNQPWFAWSRAAEALADALTSAGLGIGKAPVPRHGFTNDPSNRRKSVSSLPYFDPPLEGVYLQVGPQPISSTIEWIKRGRPEPSEGANNAAK
ncbi:MAG: hypothetical protein AB7P20_05610 [Rhizobiaceae bacterium]